MACEAKQNSSENAHGDHNSHKTLEGLHLGLNRLKVHRRRVLEHWNQLKSHDVPKKQSQNQVLRTDDYSKLAEFAFNPSCDFVIM
jgi:hypothetical protein